MNKFHLTLSKKAFIAVIIILLPVFISFLIGYRLNRKHLENVVLDNLSIIAGSYEGQVYQFLEMSQRRAHDFSSDGFIREDLKKILAGEKGTADSLSDHLIRNKRPLDKTIRDIYVISLNGRIEASTDSLSIGKDVSREEFFLKGIEGINVAELKDGFFKMPGLAVSAPLTDRRDGKPIGIIVHFMLLSELSNILDGAFVKKLGGISWDRAKQKNIDVYLVNRDGLRITKSRWMKDTASSRVVNSLPVKKCAESNIGMAAFYRDYRGMSVAGASMCLPAVKWTLLVEAGENEVLASVKEMQSNAVITGAAVTGLIGLLFIVFLKNIVAPIGKISSAAKEIARGNYNINIPVKTRDEIGMLSESFNKMSEDIRENMRELKKLTMAIEQSATIVFIADYRGYIEYVNYMFEQVTGYMRGDVIGESLRILFAEDSSKGQYENIWKTIAEGKAWQNILKTKRKDDKPCWTNTMILPVKNERREITHFLVIQEDITEKKTAEERIQYLSYYDEVTGLINRTRFIYLLNKWMYSPESQGMGGVMLLIDIDQFKFINDTYSHNVGDEYLHCAAKMMQEIVHASDAQYKGGEGMAGYLGGDEFAVLLPSRGEKDGMKTAEIIRAGFENFHIAENGVRSTVSIGIVLYPGHGTTARALFTRADAAMYRAKELGRNRCHLYRPEDKDLENMHSRLEWKGRIQDALKEDRFEPWFQPILNLKSGRIDHYEALARMRDSNGSIILPGAFIDVAERFGLIGEIDRVIVEKTMRLQREMKQRGLSLYFGLNLSGKELGDEGLLSFEQSAITRTGADPDSIVFEITETAAVHDINKAVKFIKELKSLGCHFSLDDFGVGFTSFLYLREMQVDYIKIDGLFIKRLHENPQDQLFVKAIVDVAKGMGIKTIAEFVEKEETLRLLKEYGVDYAQGYFIGKPSPELAGIEGM